LSIWLKVARGAQPAALSADIWLARRLRGPGKKRGFYRLRLCTFGKVRGLRQILTHATLIPRPAPGNLTADTRRVCADSLP
jgi:hypothetical protein